MFSLFFANSKFDDIYCLEYFTPECENSVAHGKERIQTFGDISPEISDEEGGTFKF